MVRTVAVDVCRKRVGAVLEQRQHVGSGPPRSRVQRRPQVILYRPQPTRSATTMHNKKAYRQWHGCVLAHRW
jgi:hypothetical protein